LSPDPDANFYIIRINGNVQRSQVFNVQTTKQFTYSVADVAYNATLQYAVNVIYGLSFCSMCFIHTVSDPITVVAIQTSPGGSTTHFSSNQVVYNFVTAYSYVNVTVSTSDATNSFATINGVQGSFASLPIDPNTRFLSFSVNLVSSQYSPQCQLLSSPYTFNVQNGLLLS
jgi:hypothetical protein